MDGVMIRKGVFNAANESFTRYDLMVNGKQVHINQCTDDEAINYFSQFKGAIEKLPLFKLAHENITQSYISSNRVN